MRGARDRRLRRGEGGRPQPDRHPRRGAGAPRDPGQRGVAGHGAHRDSFSALRLSEADLPRLPATVPLGRPGTPEDMAAPVLYLATPASSWVTGQNLLVGGGREGGRTVEDRWRRQ